MITLVIVLAALAYLFWPTAKQQTDLTAVVREQVAAVQEAVSAAAVQPTPVNPRRAIDSLLEVRDQLAAVDRLDEAAAKSVDTLWLELLHGSQKK